MKKVIKRIIPLILVLCILASIGWYLFVYDRAFTRDSLLYLARYNDLQGHNKLASWFYDTAYSYSGQDDDVAIELASQYKADGNYTKAEYTLTNAIADGGTADLYIALCKTFVEQDKLLDAVQMLDNIADPAIKDKLNALRPGAPGTYPSPGLYSEYISVNFASNEGAIYCATDGEYPSTKNDLYTDAIPLPGGETKIYSLVVADNGLVSPLTVLHYTVGGVIEEAVFADEAMELAVRELLGAGEDEVLMTDALWSITEFTIPEDAKSIEDLRLLPYLENLTITDKKLESLAPLADLTKLVSLRIEGCRFAPENLQTLVTLPELQRLTLNNCGLSTIADLAGMQNLTYLDLSNNTLRNLEVLSAMASLYEVNLSHNAVTDVSHLSFLSKLEKLDVSYNSLTSLKPLAECKKLTWLDASHNTLSSLKGLDSFSALTHLALNHNQLTSVSVLSDCTALKELRIANNAVTDISALASLTNLETFDFSHNQVEALPKWPSGSALVTIDGSYNQLTSVSALKNMEQLSYVYMDYNQLESINAIAECYRLVTVNVYGNPIEDVSKLTEHNIIVNYDPT